MESTASTSVDRLPSVILGEIFNFYSLEETVIHPLETVLLVCRAWNRAAHRRKNLWGRFRIFLGHKPACKAWLTRVPARLLRCGKSTPLEIDLRKDEESAYNEPDETDSEASVDYPESNCPFKRPGGYGCDCEKTVLMVARQILHMLAGPKGKYCKRWKSLQLDLGSDPYNYGDPKDTVALDLSHPTPILHSLIIDGLDYNNQDEYETQIPFFPSTPLLQTYRLRNPEVFAAPNLSTARAIEIDMGMMDPPEVNNYFSALRDATHMEELVLINGEFSFELPKKLRHLRSLTLSGMWPPVHLRDLKCPMLKKVSLETDHISMIQEIVYNPKLPRSQIEELVLNLRISEEVLGKKLPGLMQDFLLTAISLTKITADAPSLSVILNLFKEALDTNNTAWIHCFRGRRIELCSSGHKITAILKRADSKKHIEKLERKLEVIPPDLSEEELFEFCLGDFM